jgi:uncharacterized protein (TIGR02757 family)
MELHKELPYAERRAGLRFNKAPDLIFLIHCLQAAYRCYGSLEAMFSVHRKKDLKASISAFIHALMAGHEPATYGQKFMLAHPQGGGPCKRINMFLRWVVRQDKDLPENRVDLGLWKTALSPAELMIPLDTHIHQMGRKFRFSLRQTASWEMAEDITNHLRRFCPEDPVKYDFALMGFSLDRASAEGFPF